MSNSRNAYVVMLILGVKSHTQRAGQDGITVRLSLTDETRRDTQPNRYSLVLVLVPRWLLDTAGAILILSDRDLITDVTHDELCRVACFFPA